MSKQKFHVDVARFMLERMACGSCSECYVEQLWCDIGDDSLCNCSRTTTAFVDAMKKLKPKTNKFPEKDEPVVLTLKTGQRVCAKLFYDNEDKPCMYYDDFDNWYAVKDIESIERNDFPKYIDIEV